MTTEFVILHCERTDGQGFQRILVELETYMDDVKEMKQEGINPADFYLGRGWSGGEEVGRVQVLGNTNLLGTIYKEDQ